MKIVSPALPALIGLLVLTGSVLARQSRVACEGEWLSKCPKSECKQADDEARRDAE